MTLVPRCPDGAHTEAGANHSGAYRVSWSGPDGQSFELRETSRDAVRVIYRGSDRATTVTGRGEGDYHYQLAIAGADWWSPGCTVKVRPYPLDVAFGFFVVGLAVTVATIAAVVAGHRAHRRGELA